MQDVAFVLLMEEASAVAQRTATRVPRVVLICARLTEEDADVRLMDARRGIWAAVFALLTEVARDAMKKVARRALREVPRGAFATEVARGAVNQIAPSLQQDPRTTVFVMEEVVDAKKRGAVSMQLEVAIAQSTEEGADAPYQDA